MKAKATRVLAKKLGREPTDKEVAKKIRALRKKADGKCVREPGPATSSATAPPPTLGKKAKSTQAGINAAAASPQNVGEVLAGPDVGAAATSTSPPPALVNKAKRMLAKQLGREPTQAEVDEATSSPQSFKKLTASASPRSPPTTTADLGQATAAADGNGDGAQAGQDGRASPVVDKLEAAQLGMPVAAEIEESCGGFEGLDTQGSATF